MPVSKLTDADIAKMKTAMIETLRKEAPAIVRNELARIGLAVDGDQAAVTTQGHMQFLVSAHSAFDTLSGMIGRAMLFGLLVAAGAVTAILNWPSTKLTIH